jgi:RND family efflux transporter MFP subunit
MDVNDSVTVKPADNPVVNKSQDKFRRAVLLLALSAIAAFVFFSVAAGLRSREQQRAALAKETAELVVPTVTVVSPAPSKAVATLLLPAEVKPWVDASIYARASGYLKRRVVDIGAQVKAGQLLAEIETPELDSELDRARHELAQAQAALALAKSTAERYAALLKTASVSEQDADEKQSDFVLKTASAAAARANIRRLEDLKGFARVTAPFAGVVTARSIDVGELIVAGNGKELFRLSQADKLRVYVNVPQTDAFSVRAGQAAEMLIPELPSQMFAAKVISTASAISADSRTLLTQVEVDNSGNDLLPGCFAQVRLTAAQREAGLTLPANTLLFRAEGPQVGVLKPDGTVELRNIKLGRDFGQTIEILGGVDTTDKVILNPSDSLLSGMSVRIAESTKLEKGR